MKFYSLGQLVFGRDIILLIKHKVDWELTCHKNQTQINEDNTRKNRNQVEHEYKVRYKVIINNHST